MVDTPGLGPGALTGVWVRLPPGVLVALHTHGPV